MDLEILRLLFLGGVCGSGSLWGVAPAIVALAVCGCGGQSGPAAGSPASASGGSAPSQQQVGAWLTSDLPPLADEIATAPIKLSEPQLVANEFGQEMLSVAYLRAAIVRTLASELNLVLLPAGDGRSSVFAQPATLIQPQGSGTLRGITEGLLDYRGRIRNGMRAYLEMRPATMNMTAGKLRRVSDVVWFGTREQLVDAVSKGPPPSVATGTGVSLPALQSVPSGPLPQGAPLSMRCGDRWSRGYALEPVAGDRVRLLVYLVRRDKPYMPWTVELPRSELRMEQDALADFRRDPNSFADLAAANDAKLARHGIPNKLVPVDTGSVKNGAAVLDFWNGMLDPCRTTGPVQDGSVPIQRVGLDNAKMVKSVKGLFVDPFGESAVYLQFATPKLSDDGDLAAVTAFIKKRNLKVIIFDPAYTSLLKGNTKASASNVFDMGAVLSKISEACLAAGATPVFAHHTVKHAGMKTGRNGATFKSYEPAELGDLAFAGFAEFARQWLLLARREDYEPGTGKHQLWVTTGGSAGFNGCYALDIDEGVMNEEFTGKKWEVRVQTQAEAASNCVKAKVDAAALRELEDRQTVLNALNKHGGRDGITLSKLMEHIAMRRSSVARHLAALSDSRQAEICGEYRGGSKWRCSCWNQG